MEAEDIVLTYKSATLRDKDISFLREGNWLNDQIINFYYEYLTNNIPKTDADYDHTIGKYILINLFVQDSKTQVYLNYSTNRSVISWTYAIYRRH